MPYISPFQVSLLFVIKDDYLKNVSLKRGMRFELWHCDREDSLPTLSLLISSSRGGLIIGPWNLLHN